MKRILFVLVLVGIALGVYLIRGALPAAVQSIEFVVRPVFHKDRLNYYAGVYKEDPLFVIAMIKVESNFFRKAKSKKGAVGLMQLMPATADQVAKELKIAPFRIEQLEDPETNIRFGYHYIHKLRKDFGDDDVTVLAAYNAGPKNASEWLKGKHRKTLVYDDIEFPETRRFARDVISTYQWLKKIQYWRNRLLKVVE